MTPRPTPGGIAEWLRRHGYDASRAMRGGYDIYRGGDGGSIDRRAAIEFLGDERLADQLIAENQGETPSSSESSTTSEE